MIYFSLFFEFLKIGLFSFGGGYATLPFLLDMSEKFCWFSPSELTQMLAISSVTPGPIGLNMATFAGFKTAGILGSILATSAIVLPSLVLVILISKMLKKFKETEVLCQIFYVLRPATCALLAFVGYKLFCDLILNKGDFCFFGFKIDVVALLLLFLFFALSLKFRKNAPLFLLLGAVAGMTVYLF